MGMNIGSMRHNRGGAQGVCHLWYLLSGDRVRGPFPAGAIGRYILRGELGAGDALSQDRRHWRQVGELAQFAPLLLQRKDDAAPQPVPLRILLNTNYGRWALRFEPEAAHAGAARFAPPTPAEARARLWPQWLIGGVLLAAVAWLALRYPAPPDTTAGIQCDAAAAPYVNWGGCHKEGAALAGALLDNATLNNTYLEQTNLRAARLQNASMVFAQLAGANLSYADLRGASLLGAQLQGADLSSANLQGADLSYADLSGARLGAADFTGAKLEYAIWWDASVCAAGSAGECLAPSPP